MDKNTITDTITPAVAKLVAEDMEKRGFKTTIEYLNCYIEGIENGDCSHICFEFECKREGEYATLNKEAIKELKKVLKAHGVVPTGMRDLTSLEAYEEATAVAEGTDDSYFFKNWGTTGVAIPIEGLMPLELVEYIDFHTPEAVVDALIESQPAETREGLPVVRVGENRTYLVARTEDEWLENDENYISVGGCYRVYERV